MPETQLEPAAAPPAADAAGCRGDHAGDHPERLADTRARRNDLVRTVAAVPLDRAAVMVLG